MQQFSFDTAAAARLPSNIFFGTSSWNYEGWQGLVYFENYPSKKSFTHDSLKEYTKNPWFRTVGVDSSFYGATREKTWLHYAEIAPPDFKWVSKVWERITIPAYPKLPRYGKSAGTRNIDFLNSELFCKEVLSSLRSPRVLPHVGPLVFQFPTIHPNTIAPKDFLAQLDSFLANLPKEFRYAVEIRNPDFLCDQYFETLNRHGATHCFNHWDRMPRLKEQMKAAAKAGGLQASFYVARILTPLGVSYENAVKLFQPYREIQQENPEMRADVVRLALRGTERNADTYIIINNRSEGCAPMTIDAIGKMIVNEL